MMAFGNYYGGYQPGYFNPTGAMPDNLAQYKSQYQNQYQPQQNNSPIWVQGEAGAKSFMVAPGQSVLLMDSESMRFYLKSANQSGVPGMRVFEYTEITNQPQNALQPAFDVNKFVTREELETRLAQLVPAKKGKKEVTDDE